MGKILTLDNVPVFNRKIGKIDTIDKLLKSVNYKVGDVVQVLGYYTAGDSGGHLRQKKPVGYTGADAITGIDGSIWGIVHNGEVNVSWFGAKGDGVTDDTAVIKKVVSYTNNTTSIVLKFGEFKTYKILESLEIIGNNITINGCNSILIPKKTIDIPNFSRIDNLGNYGNCTASANIFDIKNCKNITIKNITFKGYLNNTNKTSYVYGRTSDAGISASDIQSVLNFKDVENIKIDNIHVVDYVNTSQVVVTNYDDMLETLNVHSPIHFVRVKNVKMSNCSLTNSNCEAIKFLFSENIRVENSDFINHTGISYLDFFGCKDVAICGNVFEKGDYSLLSSSGQALNVSSSNVVITNNVFNNTINEVAGMEFLNANYTLARNFIARNILCDNNIFNNSIAYVGTGLKSGTDLTTVVENVKISNNVVRSDDGKMFVGAGQMMFVYIRIDDDTAIRNLEISNNKAELKLTETSTAQFPRTSFISALTASGKNGDIYGLVIKDNTLIELIEGDALNSYEKYPFLDLGIKTKDLTFKNNIVDSYSSLIRLISMPTINSCSITGNLFSKKSGLINGDDVSALRFDFSNCNDSVIDVENNKIYSGGLIRITGANNSINNKISVKNNKFENKQTTVETPILISITNSPTETKNEIRFSNNEINNNFFNSSTNDLVYIKYLDRIEFTDNILNSKFENNYNIGNNSSMTNFTTTIISGNKSVNEPVIINHASANIGVNFYINHNTNDFYYDRLPSFAVNSDTFTRRTGENYTFNGTVWNIVSS